jgi:hypothetical protein
MPNKEQSKSNVELNPESNAELSAKLNALMRRIVTELQRSGWLNPLLTLEFLDVALQCCNRALGMADVETLANSMRLNLETLAGLSPPTSEAPTNPISLPLPPSGSNVTLTSTPLSKEIAPIEEVNPVCVTQKTQQSEVKDPSVPPPPPPPSEDVISTPPRAVTLPRKVIQQSGNTGGDLIKDLKENKSFQNRAKGHIPTDAEIRTSVSQVEHEGKDSVLGATALASPASTSTLFQHQGECNNIAHNSLDNSVNNFSK